MTNVRSPEHTILAGLLRKAIPKDWREQKKRGQRKRGPSLSQLSQDIHDAYPDDISGSFFKKVYLYLPEQNDGSAKEMGFSEIKTVLRYLFRNIITEYGWPEVTKTILEFEGGAYAFLIEPYLGETAASKEIEATRQRALRAGATPGEKLHTQLLQVAIDAKKYSEHKEEEIMSLRKAVKEKDAELASLKAIVVKIENTLKNKPDSAESEQIRAELQEIKQKFGLD